MEGNLFFSLFFFWGGGVNNELILKKIIKMGENIRNQKTTLDEDTKGWNQAILVQCLVTFVRWKAFHLFSLVVQDVVYQTCLYNKYTFRSLSRKIFSTVSFFYFKVSSFSTCFLTVCVLNSLPFKHTSILCWCLFKRSCCHVADLFQAVRFLYDSFWIWTICICNFSLWKLSLPFGHVHEV